MSAERCQVKMRDEKPCNRPIKRSGKCIFHLEDKTDEEAKLFEEEFWKELKRTEEDNNTKVLDFKRFVFPNWFSIRGYHFKKFYVDFSFAKFNYADFEEVKFNKVNFANTEFNVAYFFNAETNQAQFLSARFNEAHFDSAFFNEAHFVNSSFDKAYFSSSFNEVNFSAKFNVAKFYKAKFNKVSFWSSEFFGRASFEETDFSYNKKEVSSFRYVKFHKPNEVVFRRVDLSNVSFLHTDVSEIEFSDVKWARKEGRFGSRNIVVDETLIGKDPEVDYESVAQLYRRLRKNYESNYRFAKAGDFFIGEMEMRRLNVNTRFKNKILRKIILWVKRNLTLAAWYKYLGYYGESTLYPAAWAAGTILFFSLLNHLTQAGSLSVEEYLKALTNSIATFFQLRSETTFDIFERLLSIPILGLFFMALKRKFERRK